jgi:hypothetical protein
MASCCHPRMWDVLEGHKVKLWHIYNNEDNREVPLTYPRGEWILTGGNNVGLRCMVVARLMGYTNFDIFGMDCSFPHPKEGHHAGAHLNVNKSVFPTPYEGKMFYCEPAMVTYARQFFHEVMQLPDVTIRLHGDGLLQHMVATRKHEKVSTKKAVNIAFSTPITFTAAGLEAMKKLYQNPVYGLGAKKHRGVVLKLAQSMKTQSILDYGCGRGALGAGLPFPIWEYDPALPGKDAVPRPADLVVCLNVLECVEPEMIDNVLGDLVRCAKTCVFAVIGSADKEFWEKKLHRFFKIATIATAGAELHCVLEPRKLGPLA